MLSEAIDGERSRITETKDYLQKFTSRGRGREESGKLKNCTFSLTDRKNEKIDEITVDKMKKNPSPETQRFYTALMESHGITTCRNFKDRRHEPKIRKPRFMKIRLYLN